MFCLRAYDLLQFPKELARQITLIDHGKVFNRDDIHTHITLNVPPYVGKACYWRSEGLSKTKLVLEDESDPGNESGFNNRIHVIVISVWLVTF